MLASLRSSIPKFFVEGIIPFTVSASAGLIGAVIFVIRRVYMESSQSLLIVFALFLIPIVIGQLATYLLNKNTSADASLVYAGFTSSILCYTFIILIEYLFKNKIHDFGFLSLGYLIFGFAGALISWLLSYLYPKNYYRTTKSDLLDDDLD